MAAPGNDRVANARVLAPGTTQTTGDTTNATQESGEVRYTDALGVSVNSSGLHTAWFRWIAPSSGSANFTTVGSAFDTVLAIYTKNGGVTTVTAFSDLTVVASDDDGGGSGRSSVTYSVTSGVEYWLQLSGYDSTTYGAYVLNHPAPASSPYATPYVSGDPQAFSFTTSGTVVTYTGGGATGSNCYDVLCVNSDNTVTTPSGWTATVSAVTNQGAYIFVKAENGTNTATLALGGGVSTSTDAVWVRIANSAGVDTGASGSAQANGATGSTSPSFTSGTLAAATELAVAFAAMHSQAGTSSPTAGAWSTGYVEQATAAIGTGSTATFGSVATKAPAGTAAESPSYSWTNATNERYTLFTSFLVAAAGTSAPADQAAVTVAAYDATVTTVSGTSAPAGQAAVAVAAYDAVVAIGASGAVLMLDASSPGTITANAQTVQTASFTPPAGSMLYAITLMAAASPTATRTISITDTVGLTWTLVSSSPLGPAPAPAGSVAAIYSAPVISSAAMRVTTAITSNGLNGILLKIFVYTGADQVTPVDQAVTGHSAGAVVSQAITTTVPGTIPYLGNIDAGGQAAPTTAAGTGTFTTAKPNIDQMWVARASPAVVATPSTVTLASSAPTTGTVNDWVMFGIRSLLINQAPVTATAYDATVTTATTGNAPAGQAAVTADAQVAMVANGNVTEQAAVTAAAQVASVANGNATEQAAVTAGALDASGANGNLTQDTAVGVIAYDATVTTGSASPGTSTILDTFDDGVINTTLWSQDYGTVIETGGRARLTCDTGYSALQTAATFSFDYVYAQLFPPALNSAASECYIDFRMNAGSQPGGTDLGVHVNQVTGNIEFISRSGYFDPSPTVITYDPVQHSWVRFLRSSTDVLYQTSPDAFTWTTRRTLAMPAWLSGGADIRINIETHRDSGTTNFAEVDNVDAVPIGQSAVGVTGYDATVSTAAAANAPADYAPVTTTALSPYVDASTLAEMAATTAAAYLATVANGNLTEQAAVTTAAYDASTVLAGNASAEQAAVTAAAFDAVVGTATATTAPAAQAAVTTSALDAAVAIGARADTALVAVIAQQPPPPGVTSSPNRVLTTSSRDNCLTTISDGRYRTITTQ